MDKNFDVSKLSKQFEGKTLSDFLNKPFVPTINENIKTPSMDEFVIPNHNNKQLTAMQSFIEWFEKKYGRRRLY